MDLEQADLLQHADTCVWDGLDPDSPEFADAFWDSVTQHALPRESRAASRVAGLLPALLARLFDRRALAPSLLARAIEEVHRNATGLTTRLAAAARRLRHLQSDPVRSSGRVSAVLTPRLARPNPLPA